MRMLSLLVAAAAGMATPPPMSSHVVIAHGWFRALPAHLPAGGYFELRNLGKWPVTLTGADSSACGMLMLHKSEDKSGVGSMADIATVNVPPRGTVRFAPGGYHLMCMDPTGEMKPGRVVGVSLRFSDTTMIATKFDVKNAKGQ
jgi:copper(I)-binding protein